MLTEEIKQSKTYHTLIALSTGLIPPKKTRGKGSKGKKQAVIPKKKGLISADDNIIPEPDVAFELGKSMSLTEVDEEEAARRVHATHKHLVMESDELSNEPTNRPTGKRRPSEQLAVDMKKAIKASKEALRLPQQTGDSSEGSGITLDVPDELTGKFTTSSEGAGIVPKVPNEGKGSYATKADAEIDWGLKDDSHQSNDEYVDEGEITWLFTDEEEKENEDNDGEDDDKRIDRAETKDKKTASENDDQEMTNVEKIVGEKLEEEKGDEEEEQADDDQAQEDQAEDDIVGTLVTMSQKEKHEVPRSSSSHSQSLNYGNQFLNISSDTYLDGFMKDHAETEINSLLDVQIQQKIPLVLSAPLLDVLVSVIPPQKNTKPTPLTTPIHTPPITSMIPPVTSSLPATKTPDAPIPPSEVLTTVLQRVSTLEKDVKELKQVDHSIVILESIKSQVPHIVNEYLGSSLRDSLQKVLQKHTEELKQELKQSVRCSFKSLFVDKDDMDRAVAAMGESAQFKRKHDAKDEDPIFVTIEEPDEEHVHDMSLDVKENIVDETGNADKHLDGEAAPKNDWFKQPPWTPTPDLEWNKCQVIDDQPEQTWFNDLVSAQKDLLTFDELMDTPIDFSKFAKNHFKLDKNTKADLVGRVYNLLKGTCQSSIELEYNMEECHLTVASEYYFNNDLEYLKSTDSERKYTTSITKTKATRYELVCIEGMILKQWSVTKVGYDKDDERGIKHWGPKRQLFYRSQLNRFLKHDVYYPLKILSVVSVTVNKLHGYGYLEEIMVRSIDRQLYKFKEGDFVNLYLNDIEDMLLDEVFSTWMAFGGNTSRGDGVPSIKRCRRDLSSDGVGKMMTASGRNRLQSDLEDSI
ncbi:hypothetical protein Tco_0692466 [Tanacetum coccineum]